MHKPEQQNYSSNIINSVTSSIEDPKMNLIQTRTQSKPSSKIEMPRPCSNTSAKPTKNKTTSKLNQLELHQPKGLPTKIRLKSVKIHQNTQEPENITKKSQKIQKPQKRVLKLIKQPHREVRLLLEVSPKKNHRLRTPHAPSHVDETLCAWGSCATS